MFVLNAKVVETAGTTFLSPVLVTRVFLDDSRVESDRDYTYSVDYLTPAGSKGTANLYDVVYHNNSFIGMSRDGENFSVSTRRQS